MLIMGAGITGLTLAQALKKASPPIPFRIFERDPTADFRGAGWGLTIHWALKEFLSLIPKELADRLPETFVDKQAVDDGKVGNFLLYNLKTGEEMYKVPPAERMRVSRERLRALLMEGLNIEWNKNVESVENSDSSITATFTDGTSATGSILIGADGSVSSVRKELCPAGSDVYKNHKLPLHILGVSTPYTRERCTPLTNLDPFFFQATDPSGAFLFFSFLSVPAGSDPEDKINCQILTSWRAENGEVPDSNADKIAKMKDITKDWVEPFRSLVQDIPESEEAKYIALQDWVPLNEKSEKKWDNRNGRATLVGDAAHMMTMFRGEAANHGITDVGCLYREVFASGKVDIAGVERYEAEMSKRASQAVLNSRRACEDAHQFEMINEMSPLVAKRAMDFDLEKKTGDVKALFKKLAVE